MQRWLIDAGVRPPGRRPTSMSGPRSIKVWRDFTAAPARSRALLAIARSCASTFFSKVGRATAHCHLSCLLSSVRRRRSPFVCEATLELPRKGNATVARLFIFIFIYFRCVRQLTLFSSASIKFRCSVAYRREDSSRGQCSLGVLRSPRPSPSGPHSISTPHYLRYKLIVLLSARHTPSPPFPSQE